jgi:predicted metalloprotease
MFSGPPVQSRCGMATSEVGPFDRPGDQKGLHRPDVLR